ncbi:MAG: pyridoxal-phosphate dependent enzyme, partial [Chloroflexota bacterium]|nr:pyridoxal-phosphate dependent enzyme [Chloroflexota bacterium]
PYIATCPACDGVWMDAVYDHAALPANWPALVKERPATLWRYRELLPFPENFRIFTLGEGWTPLTRAVGLERDLQHDGIWIKDERQQPTSSFKDRQATFAVSALYDQGIDEVVMASTGNAATAYAAYTVRAGIKLWAFLSSSVPVEKMRELALYGIEVVKVSGTYDQAKQVAADFAARHNLTLERGAKAIPCKESMKTLAFEIVEQLGWQAPDWYLQAVSGGIGPLGVLKGFTDLYEAGIITHIPKIGVVQTEGCSPMVRAWEKNLDEAIPVQPDSLITVLATGAPGMAYKILKHAADKYGGAMVSVSDGDAFRAMRRVARTEGISMEPAASVAFAGLEKMLARGYIQAGERVVVNCSGHTFTAEKHVLEDRYLLHLKTPDTAQAGSLPKEGLTTALEQLEEQITSLVIIDDNPHDNRLIRRLLQSYKNYRVFQAYNGPDGLALVQQRQPDLVLLDLTLPEMDGFSILSELKTNEHTRDIPVIVISAKSLTLQEEQYLQRYTDSVWQKGDFSTRELAAHVTGILGDQSDELTQLLDKMPLEEHKKLAETFGEADYQQILVIEDNVWEARLMGRLLESQPRFAVTEVYSAADALTAIKEKVPALIMLDLILPDTPGLEFLRQLQAQPASADIPILVTTAKDLTATEKRWLSQQVDSVWPKASLDRAALLAHVEDLLLE